MTLTGFRVRAREDARHREHRIGIDHGGAAVTGRGDRVDLLRCFEPDDARPPGGHCLNVGHAPVEVFRARVHSIRSLGRRVGAAEAAPRLMLARPQPMAWTLTMQCWVAGSTVTAVTLVAEVCRVSFLPWSPPGLPWSLLLRTYLVLRARERAFEQPVGAHDAVVLDVLVVAAVVDRAEALCVGAAERRRALRALSPTDGSPKNEASIRWPLPSCDDSLAE